MGSDTRGEVQHTMSNMSTTSSTTSSLSLDLADHDIITPPTKVSPRKKTVYRLASSFELGDEQLLMKKKENKKENKKDFAATFQHLFGPPIPAAVRRMRNKKFYEGSETPNMRKSNNPLPVNPLTGHTIGEFKSLSVSTPHLHLIREPRMKHKHSQLW